MNRNSRVVTPGSMRSHSAASFAWVDQALDWVLQNRAALNTGAVCMSLGDGGTYTNDGTFSSDALAHKITALRQAKVAVGVAADNDYFSHGSQQGMGYPTIIRQTVSVGVVYDADEGGYHYASGAEAYSTRAGQITPFSQRLHPTVNRITRAEIIAPGAPVTSSGINGPHGESVQHGTSQATPGRWASFCCCGVLQAPRRRAADSRPGNQLAAPRRRIHP